MSPVSGKDTIRAVLARYGLATDSLIDWAWGLITGTTDGTVHDYSDIELLLPDRPEFNDRFPAYKDVIAYNPQFTARDYVQYENDVRATMALYRMPSAMYDSPEGMASLLRSRVSAKEFDVRIGMAANAAYSAPQPVKDALAQLGMSTNDLVGYFADPDKALPELQKQWAKAEVLGAANYQKVALTLEQNDRIAAQGVGYQQALEGFSQVAGSADLSSNLIGEGEKGIDTAGLVDAQFGDAAARTATQKVAARRVAAYRSSQGGAVAANTGVSGTGTSNT